MLENIWTDYFGLKEDCNYIWEKKNTIWNNSYNKLIELLYELDNLGVLTDINKIIDKLDKINNITE